MTPDLTPTTGRPSPAALSLGDNVCLALIADRPQHGWSLVKELDPRGPLGGIWSLSRPLVYRSVDQLEGKGLVVRGEAEVGKGPKRVMLLATDAGHRHAAMWLGQPVGHVSELRTEFLLKVTLLQRQGGDVLALIDAQEALLAPVLEALGNDARDRTPVGLWRRESARADQRFFGQLRAGLTELPPAPPSALRTLGGGSPEETAVIVRALRHDLSRHAAALRASATPAVVARTVELRGFGPARPGELALIAGDTVAGEILKGAVTTALRTAAADLLGSDRSATTMGCTVDADAASRVGLTCGGTAKVVLQRLETVPELFWGDALGVPRASVTRLVGTGAGATLTVTQLGDRAGTLGDDAADAAAIELARGQMHWGVGGVTVVDDPAGELLLDVVWSTRRLFIVGAGELAAALQSVAVGLGWSTYTTGVAEEAVTYLGTASPSDAVIVLSHDPHIDTPVLCAALSSDAGYVGALGSRRTQAARHQRLVDAGLNADHLDRLHGPAGLDLGAAGPPEIAVSIIAEVIAVRSERPAQPLAMSVGPIQNRFRTT